MSLPNETFTVSQPTAPEVPVIVEVPHAGIHMDPQSLALCSAPTRSIGRDADLYVADLFSAAPSLGAHLIFSHMSRYVCDLNREPTDVDAYTSTNGAADSSPHGVVWRKTTEGRPALSTPVPGAEIERRLNLIYRPYHDRLSTLISEKREKFGFVILLCGHSMPSFGRLGERRADVVPGTQGYSTAHGSVIRTTEQVTKQAGYDLAHDSPYRGGYSTQHYGSPGAHVHAIQIELSRRLYMDESTLAKNDGFTRCGEYCSQLVRALGELNLKMRA